MGSSPEPSVLLFPNALGRKGSVESVWNKFSSPYDPPETLDHRRTLSPEPRHRRSYPPVSTKVIRSSSLPRRDAPNWRDKRLNASSTTPRLSPMRKSYSNNGPETSFPPVNKGKKAKVTKKHYRISQSAEVLDDHLESFAASCWGSKPRLWEKSKSSEELEAVAAQCLARLEQMRVCGASRSVESLNMCVDAPCIAVTPGCSQTEEKTSYLRKMKINVNDIAEYLGAMENADILHRTTNQQYSENNTQECEDNGYEDGVSNDSEAEIFVIDGGGDHPPITVRPGVSLEKGHGSRSQPGKLASLPMSHTAHKIHRSTSYVPRENEGNSPSREDVVDSYTPQRKYKDSADTPGGKTEHVAEVQDFRQMPDLSPAKYFVTGRFKKHDLRRALFSYQHSLLKTCPERMVVEDGVCSSTCDATEGGRIVIDNEDTLMTTTLKYPEGPRSPIHICGSRRDQLMLPTSVRSRSEERRGSSLQRSLSERQAFRHSAEGRIISKCLSPTVSLNSSLLIYYIGLEMSYFSIKEPNSKQWLRFFFCVCERS